MDRKHHENHESKYGGIPMEANNRTERHQAVFHAQNKITINTQSGSYIPDGTIEIRL